jgi:hypothetical protein
MVRHEAARLHDQEARRPALARDLGEDGGEVARPVSLLIGLAEARRLDLFPDDLAELGRSDPGVEILALPAHAGRTVRAADQDHPDLGRDGACRSTGGRRDSESGEKKRAAIHIR